MTSLVLAVAAAGAARADWSTPLNMSSTPERYSADSTLDLDAGGKVHIAFNDYKDKDKRLYYVTNAGGTWQEKNISPPGLTDFGGCCLKITADQTLHLFFHASLSDGSAKMIWELSKPVSAPTWPKPERVSAHDSRVYNGWEALDASGGIYMIYLYLPFDPPDNPGSLFGRYRPAGGPWGDTVEVQRSIDKNFPGGAYLATDGRRFYAGFHAGKAYCKVLDNGTWGKEIALTSGRSFNARLAASPSGEIAAAWHEEFGTGKYWDVMVKFSKDGGATWSEPYNVSADPWLSRNAELAYDAAGNLHVVWQKFLADGDQPDMGYRTRINGQWGTAVNLTNTKGRTGAPLQAIQARGLDLFFLYHDNTLDGFEEVFYSTNPGAKQGSLPPTDANNVADPSPEHKSTNANGVDGTPPVAGSTTVVGDPAGTGGGATGGGAAGGGGNAGGGAATGGGTQSSTNPPGGTSGGGTTAPASPPPQYQVSGNNPRAGYVSGGPDDTSGGGKGGACWAGAAGGGPWSALPLATAGLAALVRRGTRRRTEKPDRMNRRGAAASLPLALR